MMKKTAILFIKIYRLFLRPVLGDRCRFYPSCSFYAEIAFERHGFFLGLFLVVKRILKCHPWYRGESYDPVPEELELLGRRARQKSLIRGKL